MKLSVSLSFLTLLFVANTGVSAIELQPRKAANCALLSNKKIYCFGGYSTGVVGTTMINSLDIYQNEGKPVQNLNFLWDTVTPDNPLNIKIGRREFPQATTLADGDRYFMQGGYNYEGTPNPQQSIAYNVKTNAWEVFASYYDANNGGNRQIYYGTGTYVPALNSIAFYGGYQQHVAPGTNYITPDGATVNALSFNNTDGYMNGRIGFYYLTFYSVNLNTWVVPPQFNVPVDYHFSHSAVFHPKSNKLFYIGGSFFNVTANELYNSYLDYAMTFNTVSGQWLYETLNGPAPSQRKWHTTTLLSTEEDVLLYGGTIRDNLAVLDYCYTLNVPSMTWKLHNLIAPVGVAGPRSQHAAVLVNQTSLFIIFGVDKDAKSLSDLLILDVRDPSNITFASNFPFDNVGPSPATNNSSNNNNNNGNNSTGGSQDNKLSTGAIAGIAIGGVAAVALAILAIVCVLRRRKDKKGGLVSTSSVNYEQHKNNDNEVLEVDWDKIDDHYKEINLPQQVNNQQFNNIEQHHRQSNDYYSSSGFNTNSVMSSPSNPNASVANSENFAPKPNVADVPGSPETVSGTTVVSPDVALPSMVMKIVKPDGGGN